MLCRLDGDVSEQELNLVQFAARKVAQPCAGAPEIVRSKLGDIGSSGCCSNDFPQHLRRHTGSPYLAPPVNRSEERTAGDSARLHPFLNASSYPCRDRDGADVASLAQQVGNDPPLLA